METYGEEALHNFRYIDVQADYAKLLQNSNGSPKKTFNFAEISQSDFDIRRDSNGRIFYEITIPESDINISEETTNSPEIQQDDFILKMLPSDNRASAHYIRIPQNQMVPGQRKPIREEGGRDSFPNPWTLHKHMRRKELCSY